jgi:hypothetical protein
VGDSGLFALVRTSGDNGEDFAETQKSGLTGIMRELHGRSRKRAIFRTKKKKKKKKTLSHLTPNLNQISK